MSPTIVTLLRWTARIGGSLVLLTSLVIAVSEGFPNPLTLTFREQIMSISLLAMLMGIPIAWKREGSGGTLLVAGYVTFLTIESVARHSIVFISFSFFDYFLLLGLVNILVWYLMKRRSRTT
jgi:hypothetical protein